MLRTFLASTVALGLSSVAAFATPTPGSFSFAPVGGITINAPHIGDATQMTIPAAEKVTDAGGTGYFDASTGTAPVPGATSLVFNPLTFSWSAPGTWLVGYTNFLTWTASDSSHHQFTASKIQILQTPSGNGADGSLNVRFYGTWLNATNNDTTSGEVDFAMSQAGNSIGSAGAFAIPGAPEPPLTTPEPATMGLFGCSLIALGLLRRYR